MAYQFFHMLRVDDYPNAQGSVFSFYCLSLKTKQKKQISLNFHPDSKLCFPLKETLFTLFTVPLVITPAQKMLPVTK